MTEPLAYRREFALEYVADVALNPDDTDVVDEILQLTGGRGVDVAFEAAGAAKTPDQATRVTRPGGQVVVIGIPSDDTTTFTAGVVRRKGLTIKLVRRMKHTYPRAIRLVQSGAVDVSPLATHFFPLARVAEAFEMAAAYADGVVKAIVEVATAPPSSPA